MSDKFEHSSVNYRKGTATKRCALCTMFRTDPIRCTAVKPPIEKDGLCDIFKRKGS